MKKISVEEHWNHPLNTGIREEYVKRAPDSTNFRYKKHMEYTARRIGSDAIEDYRLREMDENEVEIQILSHGYPAAQGILGADEAVNKAKTMNDGMAEIIRRYPTRFRGFATLPFQNPEAAADELERSVKELGLLGALINGHTNGEYLDADKFRVVWARAAALGVPIYLHPFDVMPDQIKVYDDYRGLVGVAWSWNVEIATHVMRIIYSGLFEEIPDATLMIGHMGEMLPYMLARIDEGYEQTGGSDTWKISKEPSYYYKNNIFISTSGLWNPETLTCAISAVGEDRIMFAVDYPFVETCRSVEQIENTPISQETKEKIYYKNAQKLFGL